MDVGHAGVGLSGASWTGVPELKKKFFWAMTS
jgi:hypothetical protein